MRHRDFSNRGIDCVLESSQLHYAAEDNGAIWFTPAKCEDVSTSGTQFIGPKACPLSWRSPTPKRHAWVRGRPSSTTHEDECRSLVSDLAGRAQLHTHRVCHRRLYGGPAIVLRFHQDFA